MTQGRGKVSWAGHSTQEEALDAEFPWPSLSLNISFCLSLTCYCTPTMHRGSSQTASLSSHSCLHVHQGSRGRRTCRQGPEPLAGRVLSMLPPRCAPVPVHLRARGPWGLGLEA